ILSGCATLLGQKTATRPYGRRADLNGFPIKIGDILAGLDGTCYVTRQAVHTPAAVRKTKAALKKAIQNALDKKGTSVVEVVSTCNSGWKLSPAKSNQWMEENMFAKYPLGDLKNV
ncbi:MAG: 2-oxoglutarate oxidoreductase, partial [Muribaculaceae bacterium]|nr:2-oxoglutarate oxidoreductase [Muribaculaceae bacterium]